MQHPQACRASSDCPTPTPINPCIQCSLMGPLLPWTVWDLFALERSRGVDLHNSPPHVPLNPNTPSTESLLIFGIDNLLYQGFHLLLIPSSAYLSEVSSNGLFLPKEPDPYCFIGKIQSLPKSAAICTQPNTLCQKRIYKVTYMNINTSLRKEHSNKWTS